MRAFGPQRRSYLLILGDALLASAAAEGTDEANGQPSKLSHGCASIAALAAVFPQSAFAGDALTVDQFIALSARLTGAAAADLDSDMAMKLIAGLSRQRTRVRAESAFQRHTSQHRHRGKWHCGQLVFGPLRHTKRPGRGRLHRRADVECARFYQAAGLLRWRDRLLGGASAKLMEFRWPI